MATRTADARAVGLHERGAASLRQHLQEAIGVSPTAYRRTFRAASAAR